MKPLHYGIIGLGQIAVKGHIPSIMGIEEASIVAISDVNPDALKAATETIGKVATYTDYHELLADPNVDVVIVATPNWLHKEQAVAAFDAGKHVFCEKPLGIDLEECEAILAAQKRSGKLLQVGHELRYSKLFQTAREKVAAGLIGQVQMMVFQEFRFPLLSGWRQTGKTGGVMLEKNSHFFDLFNWFAKSEPVRVTGIGGNNVNKDSPLIDHCIVTVEYQNNIRATLIMCLFSEHGSQPILDIVGDKGRLIIHVEDQRLIHYTRDNAEPQEWTFEEKGDGLLHFAIPDEHQAFIRCIRQGEPVLVDGESAHRTMRVALAAENAVAGESVVTIQ